MDVGAGASAVGEALPTKWLQRANMAALARSK